MAKAAIFISDFHLGTIGQLQDFDSYLEFDQFLNENLASEFPEDDLDLVFLGDIFDLWQAIPVSDLPR
jgi:UDP-2,3-diacylglucosamine pyrophosphatase LpxH